MTITLNSSSMQLDSLTRQPAFTEYMLRRYRFRWWSRYNFVTSAALDSGTATGAIIIFLLLQLPKNGTLRPVWWGNTVYRETMDWIGYPSRIP